MLQQLNKNYSMVFYKVEYLYGLCLVIVVITNLKKTKDIKCKIHDLQ